MKSSKPLTVIIKDINIKVLNISTLSTIQTVEHTFADPEADSSGNIQKRRH